ncbi:unnamed protein product [Didymodactylos carnosus]|uniref:Uncharacterized protein n=1 Tax=Didymodactylos carnosus TaxID=1234261 RepID=A0A8S2Q432_9BILA|nr:unnamed protein product [Didymodactylos carnosus]CAF4080528.1 unnamed protein product [Didymodactylos carnosus]
MSLSSASTTDTWECRERRICRVCDNTKLTNVLNLNDQPLANAFLPTLTQQTTYPLMLMLCPICYHLQLSHTVNPDILYKHYLYFSGTNRTIKLYFNYLANKIDTEYTFVDENIKKRVLEIACNDGTQLDPFLKLGWDTTGVDPAKNIVGLNSARGHHLICDYWSTTCAKAHFTNQTFNVIIAENVFAHVDDCHDFLQACKLVMNNNSLLYIQTSQCNMIQNNEFDTIYHEHVSFFCVRSMKTLAERHGLYLNDVEKTWIHGGSFLFVLSLQNKPATVTLAIEAEKADGLYDLITYEKYADKCYQVIKDIKTTLNQLKNEDYKCIGYGAAAKGNTLLNFAQVHLDYILDDAPAKWNLYTPGMNIIIKQPKLLNEEAAQKLCIVPLAWNFFDEIKGNVEKLINDSNKEMNNGTAKQKIIFLRYFPCIEMIDGFHLKDNKKLSMAENSYPTHLFDSCNIINPSRFNDNRGEVTRLNSTEQGFKQILIVNNKQHVLRGMHYAPYPKIIHCVSGRIFDIIIDLRIDSSTYKQCTGLWLNASDPNQSCLSIGAHFAHGYYCPTSSTVVYGIDKEYDSNADQEIRISPFDLSLNIPWPIDISNRDNIIISTNDARSANFIQVQHQISRTQQQQRETPSSSSSIYLIYGGKGFIGSQIVSYLIDQGFILKDKNNISPINNENYVCLSTVRVDDNIDITNELKLVNPTHIINCMGRTHSTAASGQLTIDSLQSNETLNINIRDNLYCSIKLALLSQSSCIHYTYIGTAGMFNYDPDKNQVDGNGEWSGFDEEQLPNFFGNNYCIVKGYTDRLLNDINASSKQHDSHILNIRITMPITDDLSNRNLIMKLAGYKTINSVANSFSVLPTLLPILLDMTKKKLTGTYNLCNPGIINHDEILMLYKEIIDSTIQWNTITTTQQQLRQEPTNSMTALKSNNRLSTKKLQLLYPQIPHVKQAVIQVLQKIAIKKQNKISLN